MLHLATEIESRTITHINLKWLHILLLQYHCSTKEQTYYLVRTYLLFYTNIRYLKILIPAKHSWQSFLEALNPLSDGIQIRAVMPSSSRLFSVA